MDAGMESGAPHVKLATQAWFYLYLDDDLALLPPFHHLRKLSL